MKTLSTTNKPFTIWFTGLPKSGKSTLALALRDFLEEILRLDSEIFDGDMVRRILWKDLGFGKKDRIENARRVSQLAGILNGHRIIAIVALISPFIKARDYARDLITMDKTGFVEVYTKCPIEICKLRDDKALYERAMAGEIKNFTGISDPYEEPEHPEIICYTDKETIKESLEKIVKKLKELNWI